MTAYMGPGFGSVVPVECATSLVVTPTRETTYKTNLSGHRRGYTSAPVASGGPAPSPRREWRIGRGEVDPGSAGTLMELERLRVDLAFIPDGAGSVNVFTPDDEAGIGWSNLEWAAPRQLPDGGFAVIVYRANTSPAFPVLQGVPVTIAAYCAVAPGESTLFRLQWLDSAGGIISNTGATGVGSAMERRSATGTPPGGAVAARISFAGDRPFIARPSATFTDAPTPWGPAMGARAVDLSPVVHTPYLFVESGSLMSFDYTVMEMG